MKIDLTDKQVELIINTLAQGKWFEVNDTLQSLLKQINDARAPVQTPPAAGETEKKE
jgi:hypothetical protein